MRKEDGFGRLTDVVVFDVETTGFSPPEDRIVSICLLQADLPALAASGAQTVRMIDVRVHPQRRIPAAATRVHGITNAMVKAEQPFSAHADQIRDFVGDRPLIAHNCDFDGRFLDYELSLCGHSLAANARHCTMRRLADINRRIGRGGKFPKLGEAAAQLGIRFDQARLHTAREDAFVALKIAAALHRLDRTTP